jgi:thioredoxin-like negative regulator of GroEL
LIKVFFTSSYVALAMFIGYGLALIASFLSVRYQDYRKVAIYCVLAFAAIAVFAMLKTYEEFDFPIRRFVAVFGVALALSVAAVLWVFKDKAPMVPLLGLFVLMPLYPFLSHWPDNEQRGHLFGFWFGHDMFTPPQFNKPEQFYPKMSKDAILFGGTDPGRFCPTYMIFCESFIPPNCRRDPDFDRRDVYLITQNALADGTYLNYIRAHYNRSTQIDPPFFQDMLRPQAEIESNLYTNALAKAVAPLDWFFTDLGAKIEARRRKEGVYPPSEIQTPTPEESKRCFEEYITDAQRRLATGQLEPGEDVRVIDGRVQVSGQVSVMQINGLLTKVIFDRNPDHEFYVEESFPLKWMYPHLTPFGIIMKINRQPIKEMTEDIVRRDHEFWSLYSERLCGNWINYDTSVKEICDFAERIYLKGNLANYKGDRKFLRDNDAQKAFSKLRSAIGGLYAWRINAVKPASQEYQRMIREAEFAFKQSFAFCPYSPEAVFRYSNLLAGMGRFDEAIMLARTCQKFDSENRGIEDLLKQLNAMRQGQGLGRTQGQSQIVQLEQMYASNPADAKVALNLASAYTQIQQTGRADELLEKVIAQLEPQFRANMADAPNAFLLFNAYVQRQKVEEATGVMTKLIGALEAVHKASPTNLVSSMHLVQAYLQMQKNNEATVLIDRMVAAPYVDVNTLLFAAQIWSQYNQIPKLEVVLAKLVKLMPDNPEAWYDLTAVQVKLGKTADALKSLRECMRLNSERLAKTPGSRDLATAAIADAQFQGLQANPEFKKLTAK